MKTKTIPGMLPGNHFEKAMQFCCSVEIVSYICDTLHFDKRTNARYITGVLRSLYDRFTASYPRVVRLMATLPVERCKVTGKVRPFFYSLALIA